MITIKDILDEFDKLKHSEWDCLLEYRDIVESIASSICKSKFYPSVIDMFRPFRISDPSKLKVILVGQDPYPGFNKVPDADGLAFSARYKWSRHGTLPRSLGNMLKELERTHSITSKSGDLTSWIDQGVLPLNLALTKPRNKNEGDHLAFWINFTSAMLASLYQRNRDVLVVFIGRKASALVQKGYMQDCQFELLHAPHPSPLNTRNPFVGSDTFKLIDDRVEQLGHEPIDWSL